MYEQTQHLLHVCQQLNDLTIGHTGETFMAVTTNESTDALYGGGEIVAWCSEDDAGQDAGSGDASAVLEASLRERIADIREGVGAESLREELMHAADNQMLTADTLNVLFGELLAKEAELGITVEAAAGQTA